MGWVGNRTEYCEDAAQPPVDLPDTIVGSVFLVGTLLSYLPQYIEIIYYKKSEGVSAAYLYCFVAMAMANFQNAYILQVSKKK